MLYKLLPKLTNDELKEIAQVLSVEGPTDCQYWTLEICKYLYDYITTTNIDSKEFYDLIREILLEFLSSKIEYIRVNCRNFWSDIKRSSLSSQHRLLSLVDQFYSNKTETDYLNYSTNYLLERTTHNPDYNRILFENPLDKCIFQEFQFDSHWRQRHQSTLTPLFTFQSNQTLDPVQFMQTLSNEGMIIETQNMANQMQFMPTQNQNYNWLKQTNTFDNSNTFVLPTLTTTQTKTTSLIVNVEKSSPTKEQGAIRSDDDDDDIFRLKRRFLKDSGQLHGYFARKQFEKKQNEKKFLEEIKLKQENQVEKYRSYRIGELPDIQIRSSDLIIPLQALAQYDNQIARLLYSSLFTSMLTSLEDLLTDDEYAEFIRTIQQHFQMIFSRSEVFYPPFIAALFDIILSKSKQMQISGQSISSAIIASHLESLGILTLENFLRLKDDLSTSPTKKKLKTENQPYKQIEYWLELAKSYRSIADFANVRGIFCQISGLKPLTLQGIDEENQSDFLSALNTYITALETHPIDEQNTDLVLELEHDFWTQSLLNCCNQLSNWTVMTKHIFNSNTTFESLWSNSDQLTSLMPFGIRSKLKLLLTGNEQEQTEQEDLCQFLTHLSTLNNSDITFVKKSFIEKQYPFELATFFLYQKDYDRSKYYIQYAKDQFLIRWSQLNRLNDYSRKTTIQLIQPYYELDQFLSFIERNLPLIKSVENHYLLNQDNDNRTREIFFANLDKNLLSQWKLPDVVRSSIPTWDDIVTNRGLFLDILDELMGGPRMSFTSSLKVQEFDSLVRDSKVQSSLDMAYCALRQRNFKLALNKLNNTRQQLDLCSNAPIKSLYWNEIYCEIHLKRHQIQTANTNLSSLLSTLVAKELKKIQTKISSLKIQNHQTASLNSTYIELNCQFTRFVINYLLDHPQAYFDYENDEKISQGKHRQLEMYIHGLENQTEVNQKADQLISQLFNKTIDLLKTNVEQQETNRTNDLLSRDYNALASFCDDYLRRYENHDDDNHHHLLSSLFSSSQSTTKLAELIIQSILSSMKYGSNEGVKRFSRLIQIVDSYPQTLESMGNYLNEIPCWMFFDCLYQMTAHLDKAINWKFYPVFEQIIKIYPQAIVYPFKLSYETLQMNSIDANLKHNIEILRQKLDRYTPLINEFILALNQLNPQQQFDNWTKELSQYLTNDLSSRDLNQLKNHLKKFKNLFFSDMIHIDESQEEQSTATATTMTSQDSVFGDNIDRRALKPRLTSIRYQFQNSIEKDLDTIFGPNGELFSTVQLTDVKTMLTNIGTKLKSISQDKTNLNDYSSWFSLTFRQQHRPLGSPCFREIEIPGQYTSKKKPCVEHHIKIVGFDEKILVLQSLRLPKRLTLRGHDENDYRFLVKGGEDIRQDQRIQALFSIMNDLYTDDPNCNQTNSAQIAIRTYKGLMNLSLISKNERVFRFILVIPMTTKLGMIEWLDHTRPLKELLDENYTQSERDILNQGQHPRKLYQDYVTANYQKSKPTTKTTNNTLMYAELFVSLTKHQVEQEFQRIQSVIPADLLRRAYYKLANSHEGFFTLRREFLTSYAVLCTSHYILGIGDRHLSK